MSTGRKGRRGAGGQGREEWGKNRVSKDAIFFKYKINLRSSNL